MDILWDRIGAVSTCTISRTDTDSPQTASRRPHFWVFVVELWPFWNSYLVPVLLIERQSRINLLAFSMLFVDHPESLPIVMACSTYGLGLSLKLACRCICLFVYFYRWPICPSPALPIAWGSHDNLQAVGKKLWALNLQTFCSMPRFVYLPACKMCFGGIGDND